MAKDNGFKLVSRQGATRRDHRQRVNDWREVYLEWDEKDARAQASRCMDCGVPFCNDGCPLGNLIPEWNDLAYLGDWREAIDRLHATNNFPEFTGRICPAPCEAACTLAINMEPVTIEMIEKQISEVAWRNGWINPEPPAERNGYRVAIVGSGPAGLACAQQLNRAGHNVTVYERDEYIGGLLALGIPEFKLEKSVVDRRVEQMRSEGIEFVVSTNVGIDVTHDELLSEYDAIVLAGGSTVPRDLPIHGRELGGIHFAMDYLTQQNRRLKGHEFGPDETITAENKNVVIIGGGDTGADCLGTAHRQYAAEIVQLELLPRPPERRATDNPWPDWSRIFRTSSAHEEGGRRDYNVLTKRFVDDGNGNVTALECARIDWAFKPGQRPEMVEVPGSEFTISADLVLLAMGFVHPQQDGLLDALNLRYDNMGNVETDANLASTVDKVFACGDMQRGQSLVVHAIASGRRCARSVDTYLTGASNLPTVQGYARPALQRAA